MAPVDRPPVKPAPVGPPPAGKGDRRKRLLVLGAAAAVLVLLAGGGVALAVFNGGGGGGGTASQPTSTSSDNSLLPPDERCTEEIMSNPRWVCLTSAVVAGGQITMEYVSDGGAMSVDGGTHLHIYGSDGTNPPDRVMGAQVPEAEQGRWYVEDRRPAVLDLTDQRYLTAIGDAPKVCARIATADHMLVKAQNGTYETGNCVPVTRTAEPTTTQTPKPKGTKTHQPHPTTTTTESSSSTTDSTTDEPTPDSSPNNSRPSDFAPQGG